ncbi:two-component system, chemotaxis family, sensor kinase CheA [Azospirillaceae bacterium]
MNPLLAQFLTEAADLIEAAGTGLLCLEKAPNDAEALNAVFRSVHTLKGAAGLFDIPPFIRVVHAGEDLLDAARSGRTTLDSRAVDVLLEALDQIKMWLDHFGQTEMLPTEAFDRSTDLGDRLRRCLAAPTDAEVKAGVEKTTKPEPRAEWLTPLPETERLAYYKSLAIEGRSLISVAYRPEPQCFFNGEDPLHLIRQLPDIRNLKVEVLEPWPSLDILDPYVCSLRFYLLAEASRDEVLHIFRYVSEQTEIVAAAAEDLIALQGEPAEVHSDVLDAAQDLWRQRDVAGLARAVQSLSALTNPELWTASALRWLAVVLAAPEPSDRLVSALLQSLADGKPVKLLQEPSPEVALRTKRTEAAQALAQHILQDQLLMLSLPAQQESIVGRIGAAGRSLIAMFTTMGLPVERQAVEAAMRQAISRRTPTPLRRWLCSHLGAPFRPEDMDDAGGAAARRAAEEAADHHPHGATGPRTLKVEQSRIDLLMNQIGELVVAKNSLPFLARRAEDIYSSREMAREIKDLYAVIDRLAQDMQTAIMRVRMLPVSQMFQRFPRLVRDLSRKLEKPINLEIEGEETEADKNVIEALSEPLVHIVRNSIDHGIESPEKRKAAGKRDVGTIRLRAYQEGDCVVIEISDDGGGIDAERVKMKALQKGLIDETRAATMTDEEAIKLVFLPGFSTVDTVSDLSGRGVGMDAVKTAVEKESGRVTLTSRRGQGTSISLFLPLSMAVTRVMMIESAGRLFGVPMDVVAETVRVPRSVIKTIKKVETMVLRETVVPLRRLRRELGLPEETEHRNEEAVLVLRIGENLVGLMIDHFREIIDIILKPMTGILSGMPGFSGTAILGDGRVLLVLNPKTLL